MTNKKFFVKWPAQYWHRKVCVFCGKVVNHNEVDYGYRHAFTDISGHNDDEFACKECIENDHLTEEE